MAGLYPLPSTRTSSLLTQRRLISQVQQDQLAILRLQDQVSTGRRIAIPSDDPQAAIKAFTLQRLLAQKNQAQTNLQTTQSFLAASDTAMGSLSSLLIEARGVAVTAADSSTGNAERAALLSQVRSAIQQIIDSGNQQFRGRYLFGGSLVGGAPFTNKLGGVQFHGNDVQFQSYGDIDFLVQSSVSGVQLFGAASTQRQGTVDFNPVLTNETKLADLRGGEGVRKGSVLVSDGVSSKTVDLSSAITIGDAVHLLESNAPAGRDLAVRIRNDHLEVEFIDGLGGNLTVHEVGNGTTAAELGILETSGVGSGTIVGLDRNPSLTLTTKLSDAFGTKAYALLRGAGVNNDIRIEAKSPGTVANGVSIHLVDDDKLLASAGLNAGSEFVEFSATARAANASVTFYDASLAKNDLVITAATPGSDYNNVRIVLAKQTGLGAANPTAAYGVVSGVKTLTITIDDAADTPVSAIKTAINSLTVSGQPVFTAVDDNSANGGDGSGSVSALAPPGTLGNTGNSGGPANTYYVHIDSGASTANQVIAALNADSTFSEYFTAQIDGKDTTQLQFAGTGVLSDLELPLTTSGGSGVPLDLASGVRISQGDETTIVRLDNAETVEDLLNAFNSSGAAILARMNDSGTGIDLVTTLSGVDFFIGENGGTSATQLGLRTFAADTPLSQLNYGVGVERNGAVDFTIVRNDGVEFGVNLSTANTVGDVLNLINSHPDNTGAAAVVARLTATGNGIELVDDDPQGAQALTIRKSDNSAAAWDLGIIPRGTNSVTSGDGVAATPAAVVVSFTTPENLNSRFQISAVSPGDFYNGVRVVLVDGVANGNAAAATFDKARKTLMIDIDPGQTTASTIVAAVAAEGTFSATLDLTLDPTNNGSQTISQLGTLATTSGGSASPASGVAKASVSFASPDNFNTGLSFTARAPGTSLDDVEIIFASGGAGDTASVAFDSVLKQLTITIDPTQTTALTVANAVNAFGLFDVALDTTTDAANDGTGVIPFTGLAATTDGGAPEVLLGRDTNPQETNGALTALIRLAQALEQNNDAEISRAAALLDLSIDQVNFVRGSTGSHSRALDTLGVRLEDDDIALQKTLSDEIDVDLTEAISNLLARQASLQASLQLTGQTFQLSLLDYL
jgi:flagellar hook-associated protein 3 FlgL